MSKNKLILIRHKGELKAGVIDTLIYNSYTKGYTAYIAIDGIIVQFQLLADELIQPKPILEAM